MFSKLCSIKLIRRFINHKIIFLSFQKVHMDPHNDVKSDVDYQAVLSHMNIHKGTKK